MRFENNDDIATGAVDPPLAYEWEPETPTLFEREDGVVRVERIRPGGWGAYRADHDLSDSRGQQAIFSNRQQAQRAADLHADDHPGSKRADDGLHWSERSISHHVPRGPRLGEPSSAPHTIGTRVST